MKSVFTTEFIEKVRQAKSAEEILALAKENGIEMSEEAAKANFEKLNRSGEISDEELDNVSGGNCKPGVFTCGICGHELVECHNFPGYTHYCNNCHQYRKR